MVTRILDWFAIRRSGVVDNNVSPVLRAFASILSVCHSASLKIMTSPRRSSFSLVIFRDPACQTGVRLWIKIRESWMDAVKSFARKLMTTELMETHIPSMICSAKPYLPPVLYLHTVKRWSQCGRLSSYYCLFNALDRLSNHFCVCAYLCESEEIGCQTTTSAVL